MIRQTNIEFEVGDGACCPWLPGKVVGDAEAAHETAFEVVILEAARVYGFDKTLYFQQPNEQKRELHLLGADSPGEYIYIIDVAAAPQDEAGRMAYKEIVAINICRWIHQRGQEYQHGKLGL